MWREIVAAVGKVSGKEKSNDDGARPWPRWLLFAFAGSVLLKLWLVSAQPILAVGVGADLDDRLFLTLANHLLAGQWLGSYNPATLVKGCFYPIWIALVHWLHLPLLLSQHLLYLAAVIAFVIAMRPAIPRPSVLLLMFTLLWFNPSTYSAHALRVMREGIYPALTLFVIAGALGLLVRWNRPGKTLWRWSVGTGVALAVFWQTREEGVWLMPFLVPVLAWVAVKLWRNDYPAKWSRILVCLVPFVIMASADLLVAGINKVKYGVFATVEFKAPDFLAAYGALNRVKPKVWQPHVLVTRETRESIYVVSPAFAQLRPFLEGPLGRAWHCGILAPNVKEGEIVGGCFMWALREAVARAGHHASGEQAMAYYRQVAQDIDAACAHGKLDCLAARASMAPPWRSEFNRPFLETMARAPGFLAGFVGITASPQASTGSQASLALFRDLTQDRLAPIGTMAENQLRGWIFGTKEDMAYSIREADGAPSEETISWTSGPDVYQSFLARKMDFPAAKTSRFDIVVPSMGSYLEVKTGKVVVQKVPLDGSLRTLAGPDVYFHLDDIHRGHGRGKSATMRAFKIDVLGVGVSIFQTMMPWLALLALAIFFLKTMLDLKARTLSDLRVIEAALLAAIFSRLVILSILEVTVFPGIDPLYLSSAYPILLAFVVLALQEGMTMVAGWKTARGA